MGKMNKEDFFQYLIERVEHGSFLEINAGKGLSLTRLLDNRSNWRGVLTESNPELFKVLLDTRKCTCLQMDVGQSGNCTLADILHMCGLANVTYLRINSQVANVILSLAGSSSRIDIISISAADVDQVRQFNEAVVKHYSAYGTFGDEIFYLRNEFAEETGIRTQLIYSDPKLRPLHMVDTWYRVIDEWWEYNERDSVRLGLKADDTVLELGARFGMVSNVINHILTNRYAHVAVEPDSHVWTVLESNKHRHGSYFHILKGFVSSKSMDLNYCNEGTNSFPVKESSIPSIPLKELEIMYDLKFTALVADCEGFLEEFFDENPDFIKQIRTCIFEADSPWKCNYEKIEKMLMAEGFTCLLKSFQNVWVKC